MNSYIINSETKNKLVTLGCDIGVAVGVLLTLDRHKIPPFDDGFRCTYGEFKEMLKRGYLVEISVPDLGAIMDLFNHYPTAKLEGIQLDLFNHDPTTEAQIKNKVISVHKTDKGKGKIYF